MFPAFRQRLFLILALALGLIAYQLAGPNGDEGMSIFHGSTFLWVIGTAVAIPLALWVAAMGNPLAGAFVLGAILMFAATGYGPIDGWIHQAGSPHAYFGLALEALCWMLPVVLLEYLIRECRDPLRKSMPSVLRVSHYAEVVEDEMQPVVQSIYAAAPLLGVTAALVLLMKFTGMPMVGIYANLGTLFIAVGLMFVFWAAGLVLQNVLDGEKQLKVHPHISSAFCAGVVAVSVGGGLCLLLIRDTDMGQVVGSVFTAFVLGGMVAHQMFPTSARLTVLLSPLIFAAAGYAVTAFVVTDQSDLLHRFFVSFPSRSYDGVTIPLPPAALAMPAIYATVGLIGAATGLGWSQGLHAVQSKHVVMAR